MSVSFRPILTLPLLTLLAVGLLAFVWLIYRPRLASLSPLVRRSVLSLRVASTLLLIALALRPAIELSREDDRPAQLIVLADASRSMTVSDMNGGRTRRQAAQGVIDTIDKRLRGEENITLQTYDFDESLRPVETYESSADGEWTDIASSIDEVTSRNDGNRVVAALLLSDGAVRTPRPVADAVADAAETFVATTGTGITPVGFGTASLESEGVDLAVTDVLADSVVFEKKIVRVRANLLLRGFEGREATVRLLIEDPDAEMPADDTNARLSPLRAEAGSRPVRIVRSTEQVAKVPVDLSFLASSPGEFRVRVFVQPDDDEVVLTNNYRDVLIRVRRGGLRVLYLDSARWEQKFVRLVNDSSQIQLDYVFIPNREALDLVLERADWFDTAEYDVFLVGDLPAGVLRSTGRATIGKQLAAAIRRGAGVGLVAGGEIASSPLQGELMKTMPAQFRGGRPIVSEEGKRLYPTPEGLAHFTMQLGGEETFDRLPPLERVFPLRPVNDIVDVLAETDDGQPLVVVAEAGRGRSAMIAMADTWLWYRSGNSQTHQRFWQQMLLWLGHKETESETGLQLTVSPRQVDRGVPVAIEASATDAEGQPRGDGSTLEVRVVGPDGEEQTLTSRGSTAGVSTEFVETEEAGSYEVLVERLDAQGNTAETTSSRFLVNATDPELDRPATDQATLDQIAAVSGSVTLTPEDVDEWIDELLESLDASDSTRREVISLWDGWPPLLLLTSLLTAEWFVRKKRGLV